MKRVFRRSLALLLCLLICLSLLPVSVLAEEVSLTGLPAEETFDADLAAPSEDGSGVPSTARPDAAEPAAEDSEDPAEEEAASEFAENEIGRASCRERV